MSIFDPTHYGPIFEPLLSTDRRRPLDAGQPNSAARVALKSLTVDSAFAHLADTSKRQPVIDFDMAAGCIAAVWLLHDYLDESHTLSQKIDTTSGSFWHGIMHRREGDFSNAKYWFRHVGRHPVFELLAERVHVGASLRRSQSRLGETRPHVWDPFAFVDECQAAVRGKSNGSEQCLDVQQLEWELLFDYCYQAASGQVDS